jgi:hypothetical protein
MAKVPTENLALAALVHLLGDPAPRVLHGAKGVPGVFAGGSAAEKTAGKMCQDRGWLEPTGEFAGKGKSRKPLYRITAVGVHALLSRSDPTAVLRGLQQGLQSLAINTERLPQVLGEKIQEALAPFASMPGLLQTLHVSIEQALSRTKIPSLEELSRTLHQASAHSAAPSGSQASADGDWSEEVVSMAAEQKKRNALQRLTLTQILDRLRPRYPGLSLGQFHDGLRRLHDDRRIRLGPYTQALATLDDPRGALFLDREVKYYVEPY